MNVDRNDKKYWFNKTTKKWRAVYPGGEGGSVWCVICRNQLGQYLRYFPHIFANIVDFDTRQLPSSSPPSPFSTPPISFCAPRSSFSLHLVYLFLICFLITVPLPWSTLTFRNCLLSISIRPIKKTRMTHSRPLNGMTEGERHNATCRPRRIR